MRFRLTGVHAQSFTTLCLNNHLILPISLVCDPWIKTLASIWRFTSNNHAFHIWCKRNLGLGFKNNIACSFNMVVSCSSSLLLFAPTIHLSCFSRPGWLINRGAISVHVDSWNFLRKCLVYLQKSCYNAHTKLLLKQNITCQSQLKKEQATMFNEEATQWLPYVENNRDIPTCITPY